jgi:hypothetical protein
VPATECRHDYRCENLRMVRQTRSRLGPPHPARAGW